MDDIKRQQESFDKISEQYYRARHTRNHLISKRLLWRFFFKGRALCRREPLSVLEPMCGYAEGGEILEQHLHCSIDYTGFDFSRSLVDKVHKDNPTRNVFFMDVTSYEPDREYDLVFLVGGLHHVPNHVPSVLGMVRRALVPGGYFISFEPTNNNMVSRRIRNRIYRRNDIFDQETERAFEFAELNEYYRDAGFRVVDQLHVGLLCYVLYYNPDAFPRLSIGFPGMIRALFFLDSLFFRNFIGRKMSFATLTLLQKPESE